MPQALPRSWWLSAQTLPTERTALPIPKKIDDDQQYRVQLKERVELFGQVLHPGHEVVLRGDVLKTVADKVEHAEPV